MHGAIPLVLLVPQSHKDTAVPKVMTFNDHYILGSRLQKLINALRN